MTIEMVGWAAAGGALVGLSSSVLLAATGSTRGVSGMAAALLGPDRAFAGAYLLGMASTGAVLRALHPAAFAATSVRPMALVLLAGLAVGLGARIANGCTSGHAVLGIARGSKRSIAALTIFAATAALVVGLLPPNGAAR